MALLNFVAFQVASLAGALFVLMIILIAAPLFQTLPNVSIIKIKIIYIF